MELNKQLQVNGGKQTKMKSTQRHYTSIAHSETTTLPLRRHTDHDGSVEQNPKLEKCVIHRWVRAFVLLSFPDVRTLFRGNSLGLYPPVLTS